MITEFSIEGFKSFGSPAEVVQLGSLNVVVGANASGKSNFIDALRFLQNAVIHDVSYAVSELGGTSEVGNKRLRQRREPKSVRFTLRLDDEFTFTPASRFEGRRSHIHRTIIRIQLVTRSAKRR